MIEFEWDEAKNRRNRAKHGISFDEAKAVFLDRFIQENVDDRFDYREERVLSVGMTSKGLLAVVNTQREGRRRVISARRATRAETDDYFQNRS
jgi:uncharacterized protein